MKAGERTEPWQLFASCKFVSSAYMTRSSLQSHMHERMYHLEEVSAVCLLAAMKAAEHAVSTPDL
jgi:hypothetical protein